MLSLLIALAASAAAASTPESSMLTAISILDSDYSSRFGLGARVGRGVKHPANPLWGQEVESEPRIDNGYADVFYDRDDPNGVWRMWYTTFTVCPNPDHRDDKGRFVDCGGGDRGYGMLYANSSDGISWQKPALPSAPCFVRGKPGEDPFASTCAASPQIRTNVAYPGVIGTGITKDMHEKNASRRWKVLGAGVTGTTGPSKLPIEGTGGMCSGPDGLTWLHCTPWPRIENMHWDSWHNMFYDANIGEYVVTGRASNSSNPCGDDFYPGCLRKSGACTFEECYAAQRAISRIHTAPGGDLTTMGAGGGNVAVELAKSTNAQLYVQATFPYLNIYLGVVMYYQASTFRQEVRCRLAWSPDGVKWNAVDEGEDLIPLGPEDSFESHICYGSKPVTLDDGSLRVCEFVLLDNCPVRAGSRLALFCSPACLLACWWVCLPVCLLLIITFTPY